MATPECYPKPPELSTAPLGLSSLPNKADVLLDAKRAKEIRVRRMRDVLVAGANSIALSLQESGFRYRAGFVTLTYRSGVDWHANHIRSLTDCYRKWCKRRGEPFRCVWVAELTKAGRVHYHLVFWLRRGLTPPKPDKQGWWNHGQSQVQWARRPVGYLAKYASKGVEGSREFPKGLRMFGIAGSGQPLGWFRAPVWVRKVSTPGDRLVKRGGWWDNLSTGWGYRSPWIVDRVTAAGVLLRWVGWTSEDVRMCFNN